MNKYIIRKLSITSKNKIISFEIARNSNIIHIDYLGGWPFEMNFEFIYEENIYYVNHDKYIFHILFNNDEISDDLIYCKTFPKYNDYDGYFYLYKNYELSNRSSPIIQNTN